MWHDTLNRFDAALGDSELPVPDGIIGAHNRFDVYRNNIAVSLSDALAETFPVVRRLVGDEFFTAMAQVYVQKNRPASPVLFEYGSTFGDFIETFKPAQTLPYLADVARLERAWLDAYHAEDQTPLDVHVLASVPDAEMDGLTLTLHPSLRLMTSAFPVVSIWQSHQLDSAPDLSVLSNAPEHALIVRPEWGVCVMPLSEAAFSFIRRLAAGQSLRNICEDLANHDGFDPSEHLAQLFQAGAVVALNHSGINGGETKS